MEKFETNALFFSNSNIELAYKLKKIAREEGIYLINCQTATELIMNNYQIQPEIIIFEISNNFCNCDFIKNFCQKGFYYVPNVIIIGECENFKHDNFVMICKESDIEEKFKQTFNEIKLSVMRSKAEKFTEATINNSLIECLKPLSVNKSHKGYKYLKDIVKFICVNDGLHFKLTKTIYPIIAAKNKVSACSVERDIRTVMHYIWKFSKKENLYQYFGDYNSQKTPTNLQLISALVEKTLCYCMLNA